MNLEEKEQCKGYYGFGSGLNIQTVDGNAQYCTNCPLAKECWEAHKERSKQIFPDMVKIYEDKKKELNGPALILWFQNKHGMYDPYTSIMTCNIQDGVLIKAGGKPHPRGLGTLPYPFNVKN